MDHRGETPPGKTGGHMEELGKRFAAVGPVVLTGAGGRKYRYTRCDVYLLAWFWANGSWTNQADQGIKIEFFSGTNSGGPIISAVSNLFQGVAESWVQKSVSGVCPAGATWARAVVWASAVGDNGALQCDDASLVAEPGTVVSFLSSLSFLGASLQCLYCVVLGDAGLKS